jgi:hypothetical protein
MEQSPPAPQFEAAYRDLLGIRTEDDLTRILLRNAQYLRMRASQVMARGQQFYGEPHSISPCSVMSPAAMSRPLKPSGPALPVSGAHGIDVRITILRLTSFGAFWGWSRQMASAKRML